MLEAEVVNGCRLAVAFETDGDTKEDALEKFGVPWFADLSTVAEDKRREMLAPELLLTLIRVDSVLLRGKTMDDAMVVMLGKLLVLI